MGSSLVYEQHEPACMHVNGEGCRRKTCTYEIQTKRRGTANKTRTSDQGASRFRSFYSRPFERNTFRMDSVPLKCAALDMSEIEGYCFNKTVQCKSVRDGTASTHVDKLNFSKNCSSLSCVVRMTATEQRTTSGFGFFVLLVASVCLVCF